MREQDSLDMRVALKDVQDIWAPYMQYRYARSCIICANVAESGVTVAKVGLVIC